MLPAIKRKGYGGLTRRIEVAVAPVEGRDA